jgi:hypothetical protein
MDAALLEADVTLLMIIIVQLPVVIMFWKEQKNVTKVIWVVQHARVYWEQGIPEH